ncbi:MAG: flagellar hook-associated protein FlgL [Proteobacteria bacterium]|nr:flagellar hook-associated protein FlgL [Pseudomonadota bacterium]
MRIATSNAYANAIQALQTRQSDLSTTQMQLTTGLRVSKASDDPAAAARAERALAAQARTTAAQRAVDASNNAMTLTESALGSANDLLQQVHDTMVQAGNASLSDSDRQSLAEQIQGLRDQLLTVANSTDGQGNYLFGGQGSTQVPFVDAPGGVKFVGVAGQTNSASTDQLPLAIDGRAAWLQAPTGNGVFQTSAVQSNGSAWIDVGSVTDASQVTGSTYSIDFSVSGGNTTYSILKDGQPTSQSNVAFTPGKAVQIDGMSATISGNPADGDQFQLAPSTPTLSVFDALDQTIADLKTPGRSAAQIQQANAHDLTSINAAMNQLSSARSAAGSVMNRVNDITSRLSAQSLSAQTAQSDAQDLDMTQALSSFTNQQTGYEAALKAYSMIQGMSMFQYISS